MEIIPAAEAYGVGIIPWSPLNGGLLGGAIRREREGGAQRAAAGRSADALANPRQREQIQAYEDLLDKHGLQPAEVALAWLLTRPGVTGPIVGPRTVDQLSSGLRAVDLELSEELLASLEEIFPGPGPSPESFAW
jgi:aryl-alcohol dehydrogenase-like predicted oxidoreductase